MWGYEPVPEEWDRAARSIVDAAYHVHRALGPGLLESVYEICLVEETVSRAMSVERQLRIPIRYRGKQLDAGLRIDLLVEQTIVVEIKSVEQLLPVHEAQLLSYLKLSGKRLGFLINFNVARIRDGVRRRVI